MQDVRGRSPLMNSTRWKQQASLSLGILGCSAALGCTTASLGDVFATSDFLDSGNDGNADSKPVGDEQDAEGGDSPAAVEDSDDGDADTDSNPCASACSTPGAL